MYQRGLPRSILPENELWCVVGEYSDGSGGGIFEWCYDQEDAEYVLGEMKEEPDYKNLSAQKYTQD